LLRSYFDLCVNLDVYNRYSSAGWWPCESAALAHKLIAETCLREVIVGGQLTLPADRGSSMKSKPLALLLADLGITETHFLDRTSRMTNRSASRTARHSNTGSGFPERFGEIEDARGFSANYSPDITPMSMTTAASGAATVFRRRQPRGFSR
jgi:putative transposase